MEDDAFVSIIIPAHNEEEYLERCLDSILSQTYPHLEVLVVDDASTDTVASGSYEYLFKGDFLMSKTLISIIVPIFNSEAYLEKCIESILMQSIQNFELLLIDDGSTDSSGTICDNYANEYSNIYAFHQVNMGVSSARNLGIEKATGEFIVFVDSDDTVGKDYIKNLCAFGNEDFVQGNCRVIEDSYLKPLMTHDELMRDFAGYWFSSPAVHNVGNRYKKTIIEKNNLQFNIHLGLGEDEEFNIQYIQHCHTIRRIREWDYRYNKIPTSATHRLWMDRLEIEIARSKLIEEKGGLQESIYKIRWRYWLTVLYHYESHLRCADRSPKKELRRKIKQTYQCLYFRECLPYKIKSGTLDEKIEAWSIKLMHHELYKPILQGVVLVSKLKKLCCKMGAME